MNPTESFLAKVRAEHIRLEPMWGCADIHCCGVTDYEREERCEACGPPWPCRTELLALAVEGVVAACADPERLRWNRRALEVNVLNAIDEQLRGTE